MPYNVIIDPVFAAPTSTEVVSYSRGGNASIWTGHYLAAEAFRYKVTNSPEAIDNLRRALGGIRSLVDVTGTNLLARCLVPTDSPYAQAIITEEARTASTPAHSEVKLTTGSGIRSATSTRASSSV